MWRSCEMVRKLNDEIVKWGIRWWSDEMVKKRDDKVMRMLKGQMVKDRMVKWWDCELVRW